MYQLVQTRRTLVRKFSAGTRGNACSIYTSLTQQHCDKNQTVWQSSAGADKSAYLVCEKGCDSSEIRGPLELKDQPERLSNDGYRSHGQFYIQLQTPEPTFEDPPEILSKSNGRVGSSYLEPFARPNFLVDVLL